MFIKKIKKRRNGISINDNKILDNVFIGVCKFYNSRIKLITGKIDKEEKMKLI